MSVLVRHQNTGFSYISTLKVNIMLFRILCSIEFQGPCSKNLNLRRSENCIFGIYGQYIGLLSMPHSCITRQSVIEKDVKVV
jgi:hypothetical protein